MKILLGVDTSPHSRSTLASLCKLPCPQASSVIALSVVAPTEHQYAPEPQVQAAVAGRLAVIETAALSGHDELAVHTQETLRQAGFEARSVVAFGDPRHVIVDVARAEGVDLIVVGSHGRSGIGRRVMGSVATYVVEHAPCNVLVVKNIDPDAER